MSTPTDIEASSAPADSSSTVSAPETTRATSLALESLRTGASDDAPSSVRNMLAMAWRTEERGVREPDAYSASGASGLTGVPLRDTGAEAVVRAAQGGAQTDESASHDESASAGQPDALTRSRQRDPFELYYRNNIALEPPFYYLALMRLFDDSDVLQEAIEAMAVNVGGFGFQLVPARPIPDDDAIRKEAEAEKRRIEAWFRYASSDPWTAIKMRTRVDMEVFGDAYWEVLRNARGEVAGIEHARTYFMRKGAMDADPIETTRPVRSPTGEWSEQRVMRRFRKYIQVIYGRLTYFKEFGDPRPINSETGRVDETLKPGDPHLASEILNFSIYSPNTPYGKPRWRGAATDVAGRIAAGEINAETFDHKAIPPWLILVQGTLLGKPVVERVKEHFSSAQGRANYHLPLILEAAPMESAASMDGGPQARVKIDVKEMQSQTDALFAKYRPDAAENIRRTFRIPGLFLGGSNDYTRATAEAAQEVGEEQVFAPERAIEDEILNQRLMPALGAKWWELKGNPPPLLSEDTLVKIVEVGLKGGALSPAQVAQILDPILALDLTRKEPWAKLPTIVLEALVKLGWTLDKMEGLTPPKEPAVDLKPFVPADAGGSAGDGAGSNGAAPPAPADGGDGASGQSDASKAQDGQQSTQSTQSTDTTGRTMLRTHGRALTRAERHTGVMLALVPPEGLVIRTCTTEPPPELTGPEAVSQGEHHVTLAFFGSRDTLTDAQLDRIRAVASFAALTRGPVEGQFNGVARFAGPGGADGADAVVLTLDAPGLETWREMLAGALRAAGVAPSAAHGFTPHMTVCYLGAGAATPMDRIEPAPVQFGVLELWVAGERERWTLAGDLDEAPDKVCC